MTDSKEQLHGTITARAELDRSFARLIIEDVTSVMSKNISTVLRMMEAQHGESMEALGVASSDIKKLVSDTLLLSARMISLEDGQARHAEQIADALSRLDHKRTEIDEMKREIAELQAWRAAQVGHHAE